MKGWVCIAAGQTRDGAKSERGYLGTGVVREKKDKPRRPSRETMLFPGKEGESRGSFTSAF